MRRAFALLLLVLVALAARAQSLLITTVAGGGVGDHGLALDANIDQPRAVALDPAGNLYIADAGFNRIRRVAADSGVITTYGGTGQAGFSGDGGPATAATLSSPAALAFDAMGNLYIADSGNDRIREIDAATGVITTIAGGGDASATDNPVGDGGPATAAVLAYPSALVIDGSRGDLYVADQYAARVRCIHLATGVIETIAGNGAQGFTGDGGAATAARLNNPAGITVAANRDVYIADQNNGRVRKIDGATRIITTVAGGRALDQLASSGGEGLPFDGDGGPATEAKLLRPQGLALDAMGNLFIGDAMLARVLRVDRETGRINTVAGDGIPGATGGAASSAEVFSPAGMTFDGAGNLLIADAGANAVRRISAPSGLVDTVAGNGDIYFTGDGGNARDAGLVFPSALAFGPDGALSIVEVGRVRRIDASGTIRTIAGGGYDRSLGCGRRPHVATSLRLVFIRDIAFAASGLSYLALGAEGAVCALGTDGLLAPFAGGDLFTNYSEYYGDNGSVDNGDGHLAVEAAIASAAAVAVNRAGDVFVADDYVGRIRIVRAVDGIIDTYAGTGRLGFAGDGGVARRAQLNGPSGLAIDGDRFLYIADTANNRVRRVDFATGVITTVAGNGGDGFSGDGGPAVAASLSAPLGIAVDRSGNLYIADTGNNRIREVRRDSGVIFTIAGTGAPGFAGDGGNALDAALNAPTGLAFDADGNLYVADQFNGRVRKLSSGPSR